jgi:uncharacterized protein (UPF0335 family)
MGKSIKHTLTVQEALKELFKRIERLERKLGGCKTAKSAKSPWGMQ